MQNVTGKTTTKKNSQKIVSDKYIFFTSICGYPDMLRMPGETTARRVVCGILL